MKTIGTCEFCKQEVPEYGSVYQRYPMTMSRHQKYCEAYLKSFRYGDRHHKQFGNDLWEMAIAYDEKGYQAGREADQKLSESIVRDLVHELVEDIRYNEYYEGAARSYFGHDDREFGECHGEMKPLFGGRG